MNTMPLPETAPQRRDDAAFTPLQLTAAEVEVILCFALASPLHYGPIEESLCDKLHRHLRSLYAFRLSPAPEF